MGIFDAIRALFGDDEENKMRKDVDDMMTIAYNESDTYDEFANIGEVPASEPDFNDDDPEEDDENGPDTPPIFDDDDDDRRSFLDWLFGRK